MTGPSRPPTIAYVLDYLFESFQKSLWTSVVEAARDEGANLLCFLGGTLGPPDRPSGQHRGRNAVFDLVGPATVDAVIALSGAIGSFTDASVLQELYRRWAPLPIVSLCAELPGAPSLLVDNEAGIHQLLHHLIADHGRRRIGFIRGPRTNPEAALRFRAYQDALAAHGIGFDPAYVVEGEYDRESGVRGVRTFLDERKLPLDALIGSNDVMALHAMSELVARGVDVPGRIAVGGFDDALEASMALPPLTTVRQPFEELGRRAVQRAAALSRGEPVPPLELLPPQLVVRRSCGCHKAIADWSAWSAAVEEPAPAPPALATAMEQAAPEVGRRAAPGWAEGLARALLDFAEGAPADPFLLSLEAVLGRALARDVDPARLQLAIYAALRGARRACADGDAALRLAGLAHAALAILSDASANAQAKRRYRDQEEATILDRIFQPPNLTEEYFRRALVEGLPTLGVRSFVLCKYKDPALETAEVWAALDGDGVLPPQAPGPFPSRELAPGGFRPAGARAYAVLPVHYVDQCVGYALMELGATGSSSIEAMSTHLGTSFKVFELVGEVRRHATLLEAKVVERTRELSDTQRQLLDTAHQAGMAQVAVGVLHNVGNLLNSVSVAAEQISDLAASAHLEGLAKAAELLRQREGDLGAFFAADPRARLLPGYLGKISDGLAQEHDRSREEARQLLDKIKVIRDTVRMLQDLARQGPHSALRDRLSLPEVVEAALAIQAPALLRVGVRVEKRLSPDVPELVTERPKLIHVLVNLVKNAVEAMRSAPAGERRLGIALDVDGEGWARFTVSDTGEGIPAENLERIFSYGFTTKPDGYGFGLHTCALYAAELGGALTAESAGPGRGATFVLVLPVAGAPVEAASRG